MGMFMYVVVVLVTLSAFGLLIDRFVYNAGEGKRPTPMWLVSLSLASAMALLALTVVNIALGIRL